MAKDSQRMQYKIDKSSIVNYETVKSRFTRIVDFNNLVFFVCEGLVRKGEVSQQTILMKPYEPVGEHIAIYLDKSIFKSTYGFYEKCPWGIKRKALGLAMSKAIDIIADESQEDYMSQLIALASADWEDIQGIGLPDNFFAGQETGNSNKDKLKTKPDENLNNDLKALSDKVNDEEDDEGVESEVDMEVDEDLIADLASDFDIGEVFFEDQSETLN